MSSSRAALIAEEDPQERGIWTLLVEAGAGEGWGGGGGLNSENKGRIRCNGKSLSWTGLTRVVVLYYGFGEQARHEHMSDEYKDRYINRTLLKTPPWYYRQ